MLRRSIDLRSSAVAHVAASLDYNGRVDFLQACPGYVAVLPEPTHKCRHKQTEIGSVSVLSAETILHDVALTGQATKVSGYQLKSVCSKLAVQHACWVTGSQHRQASS